MVTFLLILFGLIALNFVLLKYSTQSVDGNQKISKKEQIVRPVVNTDKKATDIAKAA